MMKRLQMIPRPGLPFSRPVRIVDIPDDGLDLDIEATAAECKAIATEAGLPDVGALSAHVRIDCRSGRRYEVGGDLKARFSQICVVTLDPFETEVTQPIDLMFVDAAPPVALKGRRQDAKSEALNTLPSTDGEVDPPDPIVDGVIDLGVVAFEFLMLARDLYPRKPGVEFTDVIVGEPDDENPSAFAALQRLKDSS